MYGPLITFEIKVNPITHGGTGRVNPIPNGASVWIGPPFQENRLFVWIFAKLCSSWLVKGLVELRLALSLIITTHPHPPPPPPGKVEMQLDIDHIWSVGSWWIVCLVIFGGRG